MPLFLLQLDPTTGVVGFGSALHGWGFTLKQFAEIYAAKFKITPPKLMERLWGDQFFSAKDKRWNKTGGDGYVRGFNQFVLDPIFKVSLHTLGPFKSSVMNNKAFRNLFCNPQKSFHTSPTREIEAVNHSSNSTIAFTKNLHLAVIFSSNCYC